MVLPGMGIGFWPLVRMAAILGGTMRSPLTGILFALELTHDWGIALSLLVAVPVAYAFTVLVLRRSIFTEKVSRRGFHLSREHATDPLEILFVREVMSTKIFVLPAALTRAELLASIDHDHMGRPLLYVVDAAKAVVAHDDPREIVGEITLADTLNARVKHLEEEERRERVLPLEAILPQWLKPAAGASNAARAKRASETSEDDTPRP